MLSGAVKGWGTGRVTATLTVAAFLFGCSAASAAPGDAAKLAPGEHDAPLPGITLHYTVAGKGPLLVVSPPGWGTGSLYLQRGLAPLEQDNTLLFIDPRGSGKSARPTDAAKMSGADMADDIEHLRQYLGLATIRVLGHSDGASIALDYAERYPTSAAKLLFVDGDTKGESENDHEEGQEERIMVRISQDPRYKEAAAAMRRQRPPKDDDDFAASMKIELPAYFADPGKNLATFAATNEGATPSSWAVMAQSNADRKYDWHQEERLGLVKAATLVIVGKQDWVCPVLMAQHVASGIAGAKLVVIDGSGHFPWIEQPKVFFQSVEAFLAQ